LPAFAKSKYSRPVALVSGDAAKAAKVGAQYGIPAKNIYNYQNFSIRPDTSLVKSPNGYMVMFIPLPAILVLRRWRKQYSFNSAFRAASRPMPPPAIVFTNREDIGVIPTKAPGSAWTRPMLTAV
jgi:hypothetical protein